MEVTKCDDKVLVLCDWPSHTQYSIRHTYLILFSFFRHTFCHATRPAALTRNTQKTHQNVRNDRDRVAMSFIRDSPSRFPIGMNGKSI